jgi:ParB family chromosome partitioning protein
MDTQTFLFITLDKIRPNAQNPRKLFEGEKFNNLVASIKEKGVIEPVLVRSLDGNGTYELVAGERRYRASKEAGLTEIPAIVRDLDDEAAFDVMTIENLQREDISELEEARSFQAWVKKHSEKAIPDLAQRIGTTPQHIRRRIRLLALPAAVLAAWEKGDLTCSHLEELFRISDAKRMENLAREIVAYNYSTKRLRDTINRDLIDLKKAMFDTKICKKCASNSFVQKELFGFDPGGKKARCTDAACFKKEQNNWLTADWDITPAAKKYGTNGFRFRDSGAFGWDKCTDLTTPYPECAECDKYVTAIEIDGTVCHPKQACLDPACERKLRQKNAKKDPRTGQTVTRHEYHGREFRERLYTARVPEIIRSVAVDDARVLRTAVAAMIESSRLASDMFRERYAKATPNYQFYTRHAWATLETLDGGTLENILKEMSTRILVEWNGDQAIRDKLAAHWGIDLARDWRITKEYLDAKTIAEIIVIGADLGIWDDPIAKEYREKVVGRKTLEACKKSELISIVLESGIDLAGKVPKEILDLGSEAPPPEPYRGEPGNFCEYCGKDLGDEDECAECAAAGKSDIRFCLECGTELQQDQDIDTEHLICPRCDG